MLGSIPRPATCCNQRRGWASAQPGLISQDRRVRPPDPLLSKVEYANRQSGKHERLVILQVRLLSRLLNQNDRVVQRLRRLRDKQETDGSIPSVITETTRSVSVAAARVCGMDEDRVQFPDGPLKWAGMSKEATDPCKIGEKGSIPFRSTQLRKVAGYGLPGRTANACHLRVMRVRLPRLPLVRKTARW